jgi:hypothetical protein
MELVLIHINFSEAHRLMFLALVLHIPEVDAYICADLEVD